MRPLLQILNAQVSLEREAGGAELVLEPNPTSNVGVKLGAFGFAVSVSFDVGHVESVGAYGDSKNFNIELSYPFSVGGERELLLTAFLHYHDTLSSLDPDGERHILEDAKIATAGLDAILVLDRDFSVDAVLGDFAYRDGSNGSWFLRSSIGAWHLGFWRAPERLILPAALGSSIGELAGLNRFRSLYATLGGGYVYDWNLFHQFFVTGLLSLGLNFSAVELSYVGSGRELQPGFGPAASLHVGLSYVGRTFHTGLTAFATADVVTAHGTDITGQRVSALVFAGVRF